MKLDTDNYKAEETPAELSTIVGEKVKIKSINKESMGPEDYYYLKKFENKMGIVCEQNESRSGVFTYKVEFAKQEFGYFYHNDFMLMNEN